MNIKGVIALSIVAGVAIFTAISHLSCIFIGPSCYEAQLSPPVIVQSAKDGTLLAPVGNVFVSCLFLLCGLFALSSAGFIKRLPLLNYALITIAILCVFRGLVTIPSSILFPEMVSVFSIVAGVIWFVSGILYLYGYFCIRNAAKVIVKTTN